MLKKNLFVAILALGLLVAPSAGAVTIGGMADGTAEQFAEGAGAQTVTFWIDFAGSAANIVGANAVFVTTGSISMTAGPACVISGCLASGAAGAGPSSLQFSTGGGGESGDFILGTVAITVGAGAGTLELVGVTNQVTGYSFTYTPIAGGTLIAETTVIPEPGTLLLFGAGLGGLMLVGRRAN